MTPAQLSRTVWHTLRRDQPALPDELRVVIETPPRRGSGDYATGVAFQAGARLGREPYGIAVTLGEGLRGEPGIASADVVGGGFVNVTLESGARAALVRALAHCPAHRVAAFDVPARDIPRWAGATGAGEVALGMRTARSSALFRVQYAHARARALVRNGEDLGITPEADAAGVEGSGLALLALLADRARVVRPGPLARHLDAVAGAFADFTESCPPLPKGDEKPGAVHRARLAFAEATAAVLADGLSQLGVTAPAHI